MTHYTIQVYNQSTVNKAYVVFMQQPVVTSTSGAPSIYTNAWVTFDNLTDGSWDSVIFDESLYASWAKTPEQLVPGTIVDSGGLKPVSIQTEDEVIFTNSAGAGFSSVNSGKAQAGSYAIVAGSDFTPQDGFLFGMAKPNGSPIPVPVASFAAQPNTAFNITPVARFYVAEGAYTPGQVIDAAAVSNQAAVIQFTGLSQTKATVTQGVNGAYTVVYS